MPIFKNKSSRPGWYGSVLELWPVYRRVQDLIQGQEHVLGFPVPSLIWGRAHVGSNQ